MRGRERRREFSVFVLNLPRLLDRYGMYGIFQKAGRVCDTYIPRQNDRKTTKRYGFVRFRCGEDASRCIKIFHGATVRGSKLIVTEAKPKRHNQRVFQRKLEIQNKLESMKTRKRWEWRPKEGDATQRGRVAIFRDERKVTGFPSKGKQTRKMKNGYVGALLEQLKSPEI